MTDELLMQRCLELAQNGLGKVSPNPLVGSVVVKDGRIVGEGWHRRFGEPHAEVNAIREAGENARGADLYVNLEPCCHFGKTPPCSDLIIEAGIARVVIGIKDPNPLVAGGGIKRLREAGLEVTQGVLEKDALFLNRRFVCGIVRKRPYLILKWAQTIDGYAGEFGKRTRISGEESALLNHRWRSEEDAVMVGTGTAVTDDPELTTRLWPGRNPVRVVAGLTPLPPHLKVFNDAARTLMIPARDPRGILEILKAENIQSVIVEGGPTLHQSFISAELWDEARILVSNKTLLQGVKAAAMPGHSSSAIRAGDDTLHLIYRE